MSIKKSDGYEWSADNLIEGYGLSADNPIEVTMVPAEYTYLDSLYFWDGSPIYYKRIRPCHTFDREYPIDIFAIYRRPDDAAKGVEPIVELYLYGYADCNTMDAPEGFILKIDRPDLWMMPPVWKHR